MSALVLAGGLPRLGAYAFRPRTAGALARRSIGPVSIVAGSASLHTAAALATTLFATYGAAGTGALRFLGGAVALLALARPCLVGRSRAAWAEILVFGASMAAANACLFQALERVPLGTAVTLQFLGPLAIALLAARRRLDVVAAVAAAAGVALLMGGPTAASPAGVAFALGAAAAVAVSTLAGERVARSTRGLDGVALAVGAAAVMTLPVGLPAAAGAVDAGALALASAVGVLGIAVPYGLFFVALRRVGARVYSVLLSLDPAVALLAGLLLLGQAPGIGALAGVALVVAASATVVGTQR